MINIWLITDDVDLNQLAKVLFAKIPHCYVPPFPYCTLCKQVTKHSPWLRSGEVNIYIVIWNSFVWNIYIFSSIFYSLVISIWNLLHIWGYRLTTTLFICYWNCSHSGPLGVLSAGFCVLLAYSHHFVFWEIPSFMELQDAIRCLSCIFHVPDLKSAISSRIFGAFYCKMVLETIVWALGHMIFGWKSSVLFYKCRLLYNLMSPIFQAKLSDLIRPTLSNPISHSYSNSGLRKTT